MIPYFPALIFACLISAVFSGIQCQDSGLCHQYLGSKSSCQSNLCGCADHYYLNQRDEDSNRSCTQCPGMGESCAETQCCNARYLLCQDDVCVCSNSEYCWDMDEAQRIRFERIAQCILGAALVLTGIILLVLFWRTCSRSVRTIAYMGYLAPVTISRREIQEVSSRDRFPSLNSIQRFVLMQLQDRPPPYSHDCLQWKYAGDITEPPPSYIEAVGLCDQSGEDNLVFVLGEGAIRRLSANGLLRALSTGMPPEGSLESPREAALDTSTLASTSQNPESATKKSSELSHISSLLAEKVLLETPRVAPVETSAFASTSGFTESYELTRSNSGSGEFSQFQETEAPTHSLTRTQNDSDPTIPTKIHQSGANQTLVQTNAEIHM